MIAGIGGFMLTTLATRRFTGVNVLHDRKPLFVTLSEGGIRNGYTVRVINKRPVARDLTLTAEGLPGARTEIVGPGCRPRGAGRRDAGGPGPRLRAARHDRLAPAHIRLADPVSGETALAQDHFKAP